MRNEHVLLLTNLKDFKLWSGQKVCDALLYLLDNIFIRFGGSVDANLLFYLLPIVCGGSVFVIFWYALLCVFSCFAIILTRKRELVALLLLTLGCLVTVNALWLFVMVLLVGLELVIVVFPDHTHWLKIV